MPLTVVVVDDSLTIRKRLIEVLSADPAFEVVGEGENGRDAIELTQRLRPQVVSMDMMMPVMTGLAATEYIMAFCATPILIVSASVNRTEALRTLDALAAGAVDVLDKPSGNGDMDSDWEPRYKSALRMAARVRVITHPRARLAGAQLPTPTPAAAPASGAYRCVLMGMSTGGPQVLMHLLPALPRNFTLPILLVIHMDTRFERAFQEWLQGYSPLPVQYARDGQPLPAAGERGVWLAPADSHLVIEGGHLRLLHTPERNSCRPSVDVLFESAARTLGPAAVACLFTGMGNDGAQGLLALRRAGACTLAQDEATSVIFGMPAAAIRLAAAQRVLPLEQFAPVLAELATGQRSHP